MNFSSININEEFLDIIQTCQFIKEIRYCYSKSNIVTISIIFFLCYYSQVKAKLHIKHTHYTIKIKFIFLKHFFILKYNKSNTISILISLSNFDNNLES